MSKLAFQPQSQVAVRAVTDMDRSITETFFYGD